MTSMNYYEMITARLARFNIVDLEEEEEPEVQVDTRARGPNGRFMRPKRECGICTKRTGRADYINCTQCVNKWCKTCHERLDNCPYCRIRLVRQPQPSTTSTQFTASEIEVMLNPRLNPELFGRLLIRGNRQVMNDDYNRANIVRNTFRPTEENAQNMDELIESARAANHMEVIRRGVRVIFQRLNNNGSYSRMTSMMTVVVFRTPSRTLNHGYDLGNNDYCAIYDIDGNLFDLYVNYSGITMPLNELISMQFSDDNMHILEVDIQ